MLGSRKDLQKNIKNALKYVKRAKKGKNLVSASISQPPEEANLPQKRGSFWGKIQTVPDDMLKNAYLTPKKGGRGPIFGKKIRKFDQKH